MLSCSNAATWAIFVPFNVTVLLLWLVLASAPVASNIELSSTDTVRTSLPLAIPDKLKPNSNTGPLSPLMLVGELPGSVPVPPLIASVKSPVVRTPEVLLVANTASLNVTVIVVL